LKPAFVQQSFYAESGFEREMREICVGHRILFQSFWTLTADLPHIGGMYYGRARIQKLADKYGTTPTAVWFRFMMGQGIMPITCTTRWKRQQEELAARQIPMTVRDAVVLRTLRMAY